MLHTGRSGGLKDCYFKTHLLAERKGSLENKTSFFFLILLLTGWKAKQPWKLKELFLCPCVLSYWKHQLMF